MENKLIITVVLGLIIGYFLFKLKREQKSFDDMHADILTNEKYKVKGQWDR